MTPKEKAKELFNRMYFLEDEDGFHSMNKYRAKQCALIAVDEILDAIDWDYYEGSKQSEHMYWKAVKQEIEKL